MTKRSKAAAEIEVLGGLSQGAAAWLLGMSTRVLRDVPELKRAEGGYDARRLIEWAVARAALEHKGAALIKDQTEAERFRKLKIGNDLTEGQLLRRDEVHEFFVVLAAQLRTLGDTLQKRYDAAAKGLLDNLLDTLAKQLGTGKETPS